MLFEGAKARTHLETLAALAATSGVLIQGAAVGVDGSFAPQPAYQLPVSGSQVSCYVASLAAVLIRLS